MRLLAILVEPFMPSLSVKVMQQLNLPLSALQLLDDVVAAASRPHTLVASISDDLVESPRAK